MRRHLDIACGCQLHSCSPEQRAERLETKTSSVDSTWTAARQAEECTRCRCTGTGAYGSARSVAGERTMVDGACIWNTFSESSMLVGAISGSLFMPSSACKPFRTRVADRRSPEQCWPGPSNAAGVADALRVETRSGPANESNDVVPSVGSMQPTHVS